MVWSTDDRKSLLGEEKRPREGSERALRPRIFNPVTYTGRRFDSETGLYYYWARYYDPMLVRFMSRDPIGNEGSEWNLNECVISRPALATDPSVRIERPLKPG